MCASGAVLFERERERERVVVDERMILRLIYVAGGCVAKLDASLD